MLVSRVLAFCSNFEKAKTGLVQFDRLSGCFTVFSLFVLDFRCVLFLFIFFFECAQAHMVRVLFLSYFFYF